MCRNVWSLSVGSPHSAQQQDDGDDRRQIRREEEGTAIRCIVIAEVASRSITWALGGVISLLSLRRVSLIEWVH